MTALPSTPAPAIETAVPATSRSTAIGLLRALLLTEAVLTLGLAVFLSLLASGLRDFLGGSSGAAAETTVRFAAAAAFIFAIAAAIASRGARRRRSWAWATAAILQLLLAIGTGVAVLVAEWHPAYLVGFGLATATMLVLSTTVVRRALGQA